MTMRATTFQNAAGGLFALGAYGLWGVLPVYWKWLEEVAPVEVVANRVIWSALFTGVLVLALRRRRELLEALRSPRRALPLVAGGALLSVNWGIFIWSVANARLVEASFGYYLNPLMNVGLGVLLLGERLTRMQGLAIAVAALGVSVLGSEQSGAIWIPLSLALSFGVYGLVHKLTTLSSVAGLFLETVFLTPIALAYLGVLALRGEAVLVEGDSVARLLLASTGVITALPLLLFASAARRLRLSTLGLFQYLSPSISFLLAVLVYGEPFGRVRAIAFGLIWLAVGLYSLGSLRGAARAWRAADPLPD
jgi:chloramphenicol-sensitive protein RarD